jgi:hypothetical protein
MTPFRSATCAFILAAIAGACTPQPRVRTLTTVAGEYVMVERNGGRLPHVMPSVDGRCQTELIRSVLLLRADGTAREDLEARVWCDGQPRPDTTFAAGITGTFTVRGARGDSLTVTLDQNDLPEVMKGAIDRNELRMQDVNEPGQPPRTYRYVRQR